MRSECCACGGPTGRALARLLLAVATSASWGCESPPPTTAVAGTVSQEGKPLEGVLVTFMPEPQAGREGAVSTGVTDHQGYFELMYRGETTAQGAIVGYHRVVVKDFASENRRPHTAESINRIPQRYRLANQTPLLIEVQQEPQTFEIEILPR